MKTPMMPVRTAPETTSTRSKVRSPAVRRLSAAYDLMNASPQGARVVPTMPVATISASREKGHARQDKAAPSGPPVGVREHAGGDVGDKGGADEQEDVLDTVKAAPEHHEPDEHRGARHGQVARDPRKLEAGCNPGELGGRRAEVRDDQAPRDDERRSPPAVDPDERDQAGSRGKAKPCGELVEDHQRRDREDKYPQELVAETGAEDRVRRDSRRIVVRQARQQPRAEHRQERGATRTDVRRPRAAGPSMTSPQLLDERVEHALYLSRGWLTTENPQFMRGDAAQTSRIRPDGSEASLTETPRNRSRHS